MALEAFLILLRSQVLFPINSSFIWYKIGLGILLTWILRTFWIKLPLFISLLIWNQFKRFPFKTRKMAYKHNLTRSGGLLYFMISSNWTMVIFPIDFLALVMSLSIFLIFICISLKCVFFLLKFAISLDNSAY